MAGNPYHYMNRILAIVLLAATLPACNDNNGDYKAAVGNPLLYCQTVKQLNNVVLHNNFPPMIASRNYVYASIAAYECVAAMDSGYRSLSGQIKHLPKMALPDVNNADMALAAMLAFCKTGQAVTFSDGIIDDYVEGLKHKADSLGMPSSVVEASQLLADSISAQILRWSKGDQYARLRSAPKYTVLQQDGRWVPTPPAYAQAIEPHWREMRPMVMDSAAQFMPPRPPQYDRENKNSVFYKALLQVKTTGDSLTAEQKHIADFWDDNPGKMNVIGHVMFVTKKFSPPGHWMNIVGIAAQQSKADFAATVCAYAQTAIALYDAFISCWDEKYRSNYVRPETVITKYIDPNWRPHIQTPPFPSYTSGHSTISAAAAEVMTEQFGPQLSFTDTSLLEFGIPSRTIRSFREAAQEASISRLYGGIHYLFDLDEGSKAGKKLGELIVNQLQMRKKP
jgi:membrane-associated phospholipid phosphatase